MVLILYGDVLSWSLLGVERLLSQAFSSKVLSTNHEVTTSPTPSLTTAWLGLNNDFQSCSLWRNLPFKKIFLIWQALHVA